MMKSTVFENWMDYVSDGQAEELEEVLEDIKKKVVSFALATGICKCGDVVTFFEIELEDGQELCLPAYEIAENGRWPYSSIRLHTSPFSLMASSTWGSATKRLGEHLMESWNTIMAPGSIYGITLRAQASPLMLRL